MKILIGVDGSHGGFDAARMGARLAGEQDEVALYYSPPEMRVRSGSQPEPEIVARGRQALADVVFDAAKGHMPEAIRGSVLTIVGTQNPRTGLLAAADDWRADLLVVGARGLGTLERLLLGSVSHSVARAARIPVLVARPGTSRDGKLRVLLACDGSQADDQLFDVLDQITWPSETLGRTITVVESLYAGEVPKWLERKARSSDIEAISDAFVREHEAEKLATHDRMKTVCQRLPKGFYQSDPLVAEGYPAEQILNTIHAEQIDLVVLGARSSNAVTRLLLGSTSEKVLSQAACSVLIVRRKERP